MIKCTYIIILLFAIGGLLAQNSVANPHGKIRWDCVSCHTTSSWTELREKPDFRHEETGFALSGVHEMVDCINCHETPRFAEVGSACADCHTDVHKAEFGLDCQRCHNSENWVNQEDVLQSHAARGFPLTGVHAIADCQACHLSEQRNEFAGTAVECYTCHMGEFMVTENPGHSLAGFTLNCQNCHQPLAAAWEQNVQYDHPPSFEIRGAHQQADCMGCHQVSFKGTARECFSCHASDFQLSQEPNHRQFGFPTDCAACHTEVVWQVAQFDHLDRSGFELREAHALAQCTSCHVNNQLVGLPRDCMGCHDSDFNTVGDPNHVQGGFPTDCLLCHSESAWDPALFDHNLSSFPLTGGHIPLACADCHQSGYNNTPTACAACHQADYNGAQNPDHNAASFPRECESCHSTVGWQPSTFDHDNKYFPIYSGKHDNEWTLCADCHIANNFSTFECINCHEHNRSDTDRDHSEVSGYVYLSSECFACHPDGEESVGLKNLLPNHLDRTREY